MRENISCKNYIQQLEKLPLTHFLAKNRTQFKVCVENKKYYLRNCPRPLLTSPYKGKNYGLKEINHSCKSLSCGEGFRERLKGTSPDNYRDGGI